MLQVEVTSKRTGRIEAALEPADTNRIVESTVVRSRVESDLPSNQAALSSILADINVRSLERATDRKLPATVEGRAIRSSRNLEFAITNVERISTKAACTEAEAL